MQFKVDTLYCIIFRLVKIFPEAMLRANLETCREALGFYTKGKEHKQNKIFDRWFVKRGPRVPDISSAEHMRQNRVQRSLWDKCYIKLYTRQYYQGKDMRFEQSQRRLRFRGHVKSIKTFGKCCWRIFG